MKTTKIEWTERTWNPVTGCTKYSAGCKHCYAAVMARRLQAMGNPKYKNGFTCTLHPDCLSEPFGWRAPSIIFVCSMSDLFHKNVPFDFIDKVMETIASTPQHTYQILTKRAERMAQYFASREVPSNVWAGVTVESKEQVARIDYLRAVPAKIRFISFEPLLGDIRKISLRGIQWVIVGGESGVGARPMQKSWVLSLKSVADKARVSFFFKQWGVWGPDGIKRSKKANGRMLNGHKYSAMPPILP